MKLLTLKQCAKEAGTSERHLQRMNSQGKGPPLVRVGDRSIRVTEDDLRAWIRARRTVPAGWKGDQPVADLLERAAVKTAINAAVEDAVAKALESVAKGRRPVPA